MEGLISIIVPCYNVSQFIEDCFFSIHNQTYQNFEAIFVNDGSTDDTLEKLNQLSNKYGKEKYIVISQQNKGLSGARNTALSYAKGEYVTFLDSDDMYAPNYLETLKGAIEKYGADVSVCKFTSCKEKTKFSDIKTKPLKNKARIIDNNEDALCEMLVKKRAFSLVVWSKMYKHSILKQVDNYPNLFNEKTTYCEDIEFSCFYFDKIKKTVILDDVLIYYRTRKGSLIHSTFNVKKMSVVDAAFNVVNKFKGKYTKAYEYSLSFTSVVAMEMLYRMYAAKYKNPQMYQDTLKLLYDTCPYNKKCKLQPWYIRWFASIIPPFYKMMLHGKLKKKK